MKGIATAATAAVMGICALAGCTGGDNTDKTGGDDGKKDPPITVREPVSRICKTESGKTYLEVDGRPFAIVGGQVRVDGWYNRSESFPDAMPPIDAAEEEKYFEKANELGLNTLELALEWSRIEKAKDVYDFALVDRLLGYCNKYGLKCEFLWFSTNMCGDTHSFTLPDYIYSDSETYPRLEGGTYWSHMYGDTFHLVLNNENLMQREKLVLEKLMAHVDEWNIANGEKNPLIGIQVHNESDGLVRWRIDQSKLKIDGRAATQRELWQMTLDALDNAGKAIKSADYKIYTRCNMTTSYSMNEYAQCEGTGISPKDVLALDGIDMVGDDPYITSPAAIAQVVEKYSAEGNYPHIAENMGNYPSSPSMLLATYAAGGAYMFYDLATPRYFIQINGNGSYQMDQGILNPDFTYKAHTALAKDIIKGIRAMGDILPVVEKGSFAAFNIETELPVANYEKTLSAGGIDFTLDMQEAGLAFAAVHDGYMYLYATENAAFKAGTGYVLKAETGAQTNGEWVKDGETFINPTGITVEKCKLYRIKLRAA